MTKRRREGTLITTVDVIRSGRIEHLDDEAYGVIRGEDDFLSKAERLAKELLNGPPSLRQDWAAHLQLYVHVLRRETHRDGPLDAGRVQNIIFRMMHAAFFYRSLLNELSTDIPSKKAGLTRGEYLAFRAKAKSRKDLAELCGTEDGLRCDGVSHRSSSSITRRATARPVRRPVW